MSSHQKFQEILSEAKIISTDYHLCDVCLGRLYAKKMAVSSNDRLGKKLQTLLKTKATKCYICKNLLENLQYPLKAIIEATSDMQFSTFVIGATIKPSLIDRDDFIKSKFKLRGIDGIKTSITKELSKKFSKKTRSKIDFNSPDVTITFNFKDNTCDVKSKPVFVFGKYTKEKRGLEQKQKSCSNCRGKGCVVCQFHGIGNFESVEGSIAKILYQKFSSPKVKISWIGGEDKDSLVLGRGRPFFAKILNPKKRKLKFPSKIKVKEITIHNLRIIDKVPSGPLQFISKIEITVLTKKPIDTKLLKSLKKITKSPVVIYEKFGRRNEKFIHNLKYKKTSQNSFSLTIKTDGGLPVKHFVNGQNVFPNLSDLLDNQCTCKKFDFHEVILQ